MKYHNKNLNCQEERRMEINIRKMQQDFESESLLKLKEERKRREAILCLREEAIKRKKAELDRYEDELKAKLEKERMGLLAYLDEHQNREIMLNALKMH